MNLRTPFVTSLILFLTLSLSVSLAASPVAMVTDIVGKVTVTGNKRQNDLNILDNVTAGMEIHIAEQGKMVLVYLDSGQEYAIQGKTDVEIGASEVISHSGQTIKGKDLNKYRDVQFKPLNALQAAAEMRSGSSKHIKLRFLNLNGSKTLSNRPTFRWQAIQPNLTYRFELFNTEGETLLEKEVSGTVLKLPESMNLDWGKVYSWELSTQLPNRKRYTNFSDFRVATKQERDLINKLRPDEKAPVAELVLFASVLEQYSIQDEALIYWKKVVQKRDGQPNLKNRVIP